jgi:hydroxyacylglutathione hydrolase
MQKEKNQNKIFFIGFSLIVLVLLWFLVKPLISSWKKNEAQTNDAKLNEEILKAPSALPEDLYQKTEADSKIFILDTSSSDEFQKGHIAKSINVSANDLNKDYLDSVGIDKASDIFIVNRDGNLADLTTSVNKLVSAGFVNAKYVRGGIEGWKEKGYPLISAGSALSDNAKVRKISIDEIKKEAENGSDIFQFIDVRNQEDFSSGHIVGAINIPLPQIEMKENEVSAVKKVVVYGANSNESFQAAATLFDLNFFNVYQLDATLEDWKTAGGVTANGQ